MQNDYVQDSMALAVKLLVKQSVNSMHGLKNSGEGCCSTVLLSALNKLTDKELTELLYHFLDLYYDNLSQLSAAIEDMDS